MDTYAGGVGAPETRAIVNVNHAQANNRREFLQVLITRRKERFGNQNVALHIFLPPNTQMYPPLAAMPNPEREPGRNAPVPSLYSVPVCTRKSARKFISK